MRMSVDSLHESQPKIPLESSREILDIARSTAHEHPIFSDLAVGLGIPLALGLWLVIEAIQIAMGGKKRNPITEVYMGVAIGNYDRVVKGRAKNRTPLL